MPVCITGMHRSGTSMVARMLNICGLYLGEENDIMCPQPDNPEGFWENVHFVTLNDEILSKLGGAWDLPPRNLKNWEKQPKFTPLYDRAAEVIKKFNGHEPWGWKDPRNSLTIPFWKRVTKNLNFIICIRNPLEIAKSLWKRGANSDVFSFHLWFIYNQRLLTYAKPRNRIITHYESYFINPKEELRRVLYFLKFQVSEEIIDKACITINRSLRHHDAKTTVRIILPKTARLYEKMCLAAGPTYKQTAQTPKTIAPHKPSELVYYEKAVELNPDDINALKDLAEHYNELYHVKDAFNAYLKILDKLADDVEVLQKLAHLAAVLKRFDDSKKFYERIEEIENKQRKVIQLNPEKTEDIAIVDDKDDHHVPGIKKLSSRFFLDKISSYEEFKIYFSEMRDAHNLRAQFERSLLKDSKPFTVGGYCYVCKKKADFLVDYQYASEINGVLTPNWRERLVCPSCGFNNRTRAAIHLFRKLLRPSKSSQIYITEQLTPLFKWFSKNYSNVIGSEFLGDQVSYGQTNDAGIRNEDMTRLSFSDNYFNSILSFDVLEHIPHYNEALKECLRVLKPKGAMLFSIPFAFTERNIVRAVKNEDGSIQNIFPAEFHGDPNSCEGCLCYYHFGWELLDQMREIGFSDASAYFYWSKKFGYLGTAQILFVGKKSNKRSVTSVAGLKSEENPQKESQPDSDEITTLKNLAITYYGSGRFDDAFQIYKKIHEDYPEDTEILQELAHLSTVLKNFGEADRFYKEIEKIENENIDAKKTPDVAGLKAEENPQKESQPDSDEIAALKNQAISYYGSGRFDDAFQIYKKIHEDYPEDTEILQELAHLSTVLGRFSEAEQFYKEVEKIENKNIEMKEPRKTLPCDKNISIPRCEISRDSSMRNFCAAPWVEGVIRMNGNVQTCCRNGTVFGNLKEQTLEEAWRSEAFQNFRRKIAIGEFPDEQCRNCYGNGTVRSLFAEFSGLLDLHASTTSNSLSPYFVHKLGDILSLKTIDANTEALLEECLSEVENLRRKQDIIDADVKMSLKKMSLIGQIIKDYLKGNLSPEIVAPNRQVNLISHCNARCLMCPGRYTGELYKKRSMDKTLISMAFAEPEHIIDFFMNGSEFLLYPDWKKVAKLLTENGVKLSISTNSILLNPHNIRYLIDNKIIKNLNVSMDGATKDTLERIRVNVNYDKLLQNLSYLFSYSTKKQYLFQLSFSFVLMQQNYSEFPLLIRLINNVRKGYNFPAVNIYCQSLETYNIKDYNELYKEQHHSVVDRVDLIKIFDAALEESVKTNIKVGAFYAYDIKDFIQLDYPFPVYVNR